MKTNPILEEVWQIKDQLAQEAGYDIDRFFEQLRAWSVAHPHHGPVARSPEELQRIIAHEPSSATVTGECEDESPS